MKKAIIHEYTVPKLFHIHLYILYNVANKRKMKNEYYHTQKIHKLLQSFNDSKPKMQTNDTIKLKMKTNKQMLSYIITHKFHKSHFDGSKMMNPPYP